MKNVYSHLDVIPTVNENLRIVATWDDEARELVITAGQATVGLLGRHTVRAAPDLTRLREQPDPPIHDNRELA